MFSNLNGSSNGKRITILFILSFLPLLLLILLVTKYWINVPYWDQWDISVIFDKYYSGTLGFSEFIRQHNESRKLFPKLIFLGSGLLTGWDVRVEMSITIIFASLISLNIFVLLSRIKRLNTTNKLSLLVLINILLFSPVQRANWLWGIQLIVFIPALMLTTGLIVNTSDMPIPKKLAYNAVLSFVSTFSYANGMLVWILLLPINIFFEDKSDTQKESIKKSFLSVILYIASAALTIGYYFKDYVKPPTHPSFPNVASNPLNITKYFLTWVGSPFVPQFSSWNSGFRIFIGGLFVAVFLFALCYSLFFKFKSSDLNYFYPWFIIGFYALISGAVTTVGRVGFGIGQATSPRYTSFSVFLPVSLVVIVFLMYQFFITDEKKNSKANCIAIATVLSFFLILQLQAFDISVKTIQNQSVLRDDGKIALQYYKIFQDDKKLELLYPDAQRLIDRFTKLSAFGLLDFKPASSDILGFLGNPSQDGEKSNGFLGKCSLDEKNLSVFGWAINSKTKTPADAVILVYTDDEVFSKPFAILRVGIERPDVASVYNAPSMLLSGYRDEIDTSSLPSGELMISAWIVDINTDMAYQLANTCNVEILQESSQFLTGSFQAL